MLLATFGGSKIGEDKSSWIFSLFLVFLKIIHYCIGTKATRKFDQSISRSVHPVGSRHHLL